MLFHEVVHLHPVNLHLYGLLALYGLAHPRTFGLHVYEQIVRTVKRILSFLVGLNARNLRHERLSKVLPRKWSCQVSRYLGLAVCAVTEEAPRRRARIIVDSLIGKFVVLYKTICCCIYKRKGAPDILKEGSQGRLLFKRLDQSVSVLIRGSGSSRSTSQLGERCRALRSRHASCRGARKT